MEEFQICDFKIVDKGDGNKIMYVVSVGIRGFKIGNNDWRERRKKESYLNRGI